MALIKLNECYGSTIDLVEFSIRQEVGETLAPSTLFRRNCLATKVGGFFFVLALVVRRFLCLLVGVVVVIHCLVAR